MRLLFTARSGVVDENRVVVTSRGLTIGRDISGDGRISIDTDPRVSRNHASLSLSGDRQFLEVVDKGSRNGTFINGDRIQEEMMADGDVLRVADSLLIFLQEPVEAVDAVVKDFIGRSPAACELRDLLRRTAASPASVVLLGESGSGKGVAAKSIHELSPRKGPLVTLNCSTIPRELAESQLFGHVKGAFSGATSDHPGVFRAANGGTLLLDEIGDLPLGVQPKLLLALENQVVTPVGTVHEIPVDTRVVAATNIDLRSEVASKRFRGDLWARLGEMVIELPPLRHRREDILVEGAGHLMELREQGVVDEAGRRVRIRRQGGFAGLDVWCSCWSSSRRVPVWG